MWGLKKVRKRLARRDWRPRAEELLRTLVPPGTKRSGKVLGERLWREWKGVSWDIDGEREETEEEGRLRALARK